jgi:hypothetical protein
MAHTSPAALFARQMFLFFLAQTPLRRLVRLIILAGVIVGGLSISGNAAEDSAPHNRQSTDEESTPVLNGKTKRCTVRHGSDGWWLVAPNGKPFFSLGVCMFNQGMEGNKYDAAKPCYVALRHYATPEAWAKASLARLGSWGFTTVGGWSDYETVRRASDDEWWLTPVLHMGSTSGVPWFDMWDEKVIRRVEEVAERGIRPLRGESRVLGYYSDNELGWWNAILWKMTLEQPPTSGQRQRLVKLIRESYGNDWQKLLGDFEPEGATNWGEFARGGMLWLRPGGNGIATYRRFLSLAADRYYQLMRDTIRKFDPNALYLGDRYQSFYYPEVAQAARPYVDVISTNLNASWNDGTFIRSYLDSLHSLSEKPVVVSEFYMAAADNQSGNPNKVGGFPIVATQAERAQALSNTLQSLARLPYVVGADWFQYYDEPPQGRSLDGEDYNFGLVDIHDRPYADVTAAFGALDLPAIKRTAAVRSADAAAVVPPAPAEPLGDFRSMHALKSWDRVRGFIAPISPHPRGDLYACWSPTALYLATYVIDIVEPDYYRTGEVPDEDRATWTICINDGEPISVRIGSGKPPAASDPSFRVESLGGTYHDVRSITAIELPVAKLNRSALQPGDNITLDSSYTTHGQAYRIDWRVELVLEE